MMHLTEWIVFHVDSLVYFPDDLPAVQDRGHVDGRSLSRRPSLFASFVFVFSFSRLCDLCFL